MRRASLLLSPWTPQCTFTVAPPRIVAVQVIHPRWWGGVECYRNRGRHAKKRERQKLVHGTWRVRSDGMRGGVQNIMPSLFSCIQVSLPVADFQIFDMLRYASICFDISRLWIAAAVKQKESGPDHHGRMVSDHFVGGIVQFVSWKCSMLFRAYCFLCYLLPIVIIVACWLDMLVGS